MNILNVIAGLQPTGGGLSEFLPRLTIELARLGNSVTIATVARADEQLVDAAEAAAAEGVKIVRFAPSCPRALFFSWEMRWGLPELARSADVVHVHSSWTFPVWWGSQCALRADAPLVLSPHGCLDSLKLARSAWKKRFAGVLDRRYLRQATAIHATSEMERGWIEKYAGRGLPIRVIPNGAELPDSVVTVSKPVSRMRQVLYLGRLHPLKGLDLLLDAWAMVSQPDMAAGLWQLVIAGPDEQGMRQRLENQARSLGLANVSFPGPLYGEHKNRALAEADLFILPSRSENFGIVVAEALAAGLPVITTKGTPWSEIQGSCGWWVEVSAQAIAKALAEAMHCTDANRRDMGQRGRDFVKEKYQWTQVGRAMMKLYEDITSPQPGNSRG